MHYFLKHESIEIQEIYSLKPETVLKIYNGLLGDPYRQMRSVKVIPNTGALHSAHSIIKKQNVKQIRDADFQIPTKFARN